MKSEYVEDTIAALKESDIDFGASLPDSWLVSVIGSVEDDPAFDHMPVCNEGIGFSACVGAWFGGKKPVLMMENSGLRTAAEPIARLNLSAGGGGGAPGVGVLILTSYRGDLGDTPSWAINHGITCEPLLEALRVPYTVARSPEELRPAIKRASRTAFHHVTPAAVLVSGSLTMED